MPRSRSDVVRMINASDFEAAVRAIAELEAEGSPQTQADGLWLRGLLAARQYHLTDSVALHEEALAAYREIGDRMGEANALDSMGDALRMLDRHEQALGRHEEALGRHEEALVIYREIGNRLGEANALNSMGNALRMLERYEEALGRHEEALVIYREIGNRLGEANARRAIGLCQRALGDSDLALESLRSAARIYAEIGLPRWAALAGAMAKTAEAQVSGVPATPVQDTVATFLDRVDAHIGPLLQRLDRADQDQVEFLYRKGLGPGQALVFAREWNSWQPLVPAAGWPRGGGYLLRWGSKGVAIDPGPGFVSILREGGFGLRDIDAVVVTHNHIDHVAELPHLLTLVHEHNEHSSQATRTVDLFLSPSVMQAYIGMTATSRDVGRLVRLLPGEPVSLPDYCLEIVPFSAHHSELGGARFALCLAFRLQDPAGDEGEVGTVLLTGDTGWREDLPILNAAPDLPRPLTLVAHLGTLITAQEGGFDAEHLEYRGVAALMHHLRNDGQLPECTVLSEFGLECRTIIREMVEGLRALTGGACIICAGTMGRTILLPAMAPACDFGGWGVRGCGAASSWTGVSDDLARGIHRCDRHRTS